MKYITRSTDREVFFYEDEIEKAIKYFSIKEKCGSLEEIADCWNTKHSGEAIGELIICEI